MMSPHEIRSFTFDHEGSHFVIVATPGRDAYELAVLKDGVRVRSAGRVLYEHMNDAMLAGLSADPVEIAMKAVREEVLAVRSRQSE